MASWPSTLPEPVSDNYGVDPVDQVIRTSMESGPARTRRRTTNRNDHVTASWFMTDAQVAIFRTWFDNALEAAGGASWFTVTLALATGGKVSTTAKFIGPPKMSHAGGLQWSVSAQLEIR